MSRGAQIGAAVLIVLIAAALVADTPSTGSVRYDPVAGADARTAAVVPWAQPAASDRLEEPDGATSHSYDGRSQLAQASARLGGYGRAPKAPRLNLPFRDAGLRSQVDDVVRHVDEFGRPPTGVAQGGLRGHPRGTYGGQGLPDRQLGYYTESDVWTSGGGIKRGAERLVFGRGGDVYYTPNHYESFVRIR